LSGGSSLISEKLFRSFAVGLESSSAIIGSILKAGFELGSCSGAATDIFGAGEAFAEAGSAAPPVVAPAAAADVVGLANAGDFSGLFDPLHCSRSRISSWPD